MSEMESQLKRIIDRMGVNNDQEKDSPEIIITGSRKKFFDTIKTLDDATHIELLIKGEVAEMRTMFYHFMARGIRIEITIQGKKLIHDPLSDEFAHQKEEDILSIDGKVDTVRSIPTLKIRNLTIFLDLVDQVTNLAMEKKWFSAYKPYDIFLNATPYDFEEPELFLEKQKYQLEHDVFEDPNEQWKNSAQVDEEMYIMMREIIPVQVQESPHELQLALSKNDRGPFDSEVLPAIRYAQSSENEITLYAVQNPRIKGLSLDEAQQHLDNIQRHIDGFLAEIQKIEENFFERMKWQGKITIDNVEEFIKAFDEYIEWSDEKTRNVDKWEANDAILRRFPNLNRSLLRAFENLLESRKKGVADIQYIIKILKKRKRKNAKYRKYFRETEKEKTVSSPDKHISMVIALQMFVQAGITIVRIPLQFPLRERRDETIDSRIIDNMIALAQDLEREIVGVTLEPDEYDDTFHLQLKITPPLSSDRPFVQKLLDSINLPNAA